MSDAIVTPIQPALFSAPMAALLPTSMDMANRLLVAWGHRLGPVNRPFGQEAYYLEVAGELVSIATSGSTVSSTVAEYSRQDVVELTRLCSRPDASWATRVMLRLWREACAPIWFRGPVRAAVSYSHNSMHKGHLYRMDGWEKIREDCGTSSGGGGLTLRRSPTNVVSGSKTLWLWRYREKDT